MVEPGTAIKCFSSIWPGFFYMRSAPHVFTGIELKKIIIWKAQGVPQ